MTPKSPSPRSSRAAPGKGASVEALIAALDHPLKAAVEALRATIRAVSPRIQEEVKWNSPSFYTSDHFATLNIGRKTRQRPDDHVLVIFRSLKEVKAKAPHLGAIIRQWIKQL